MKVGSRKEGHKRLKTFDIFCILFSDPSLRHTEAHDCVL